MFNPLNEFPHTIELGSREVVGEYPREQERFKSEKQYKDLWIRLLHLNNSSFIK